MGNLAQKIGSQIGHFVSFPFEGSEYSGKVDSASELTILNATSKSFADSVQGPF